MISLFVFGNFDASNIITEILRINKWIVFLVTIFILFIYFKSARNLNKPSKNLYKFAIFTGFLHFFHGFAEKMYVDYYLHVDMLNDATSILGAANFICYAFLFMKMRILIKLKNHKQNEDIDDDTYINTKFQQSIISFTLLICIFDMLSFVFGLLPSIMLWFKSIIFIMLLTQYYM